MNNPLAEYTVPSYSFLKHLLKSPREALHYKTAERQPTTKAQHEGNVFEAFLINWLHPFWLIDMDHRPEPEKTMAGTEKNPCRCRAVGSRQCSG